MRGTVIRRRSTRFSLALLVAGVAGSAVAGGAAASTAWVELVDRCGPLEVAVHYAATPGEVNKLAAATVPLDDISDPLPFQTCVGGRADHFGHVVFNDPGAWINPGTGCKNIRKRQAICSWQAPVVIELGDLDDFLALAVLGDPTTTIDAGTGNDTLRTLSGMRDIVECGPGVDSVTADASDQLTNCENITRLP